MTGVLKSLRDYHKQEKPTKVTPLFGKKKEETPKPSPKPAAAKPSKPASSSKPKPKEAPKSASTPKSSVTGRKPTGPAKQSDKEKDRSVPEKRFARAGGARPEGPTPKNNDKLKPKKVVGSGGPVGRGKRRPVGTGSIVGKGGPVGKGKSVVGSGGIVGKRKK